MYSNKPMDRDAATRMIAVVRGEYDWDDDGHSKYIAHSITDWTEVTEEEFQTLQGARYTYGYKVIERPLDEKKFVEETVAETLERIKREGERRAREEKDRKARNAKQKADRERKRYEKMKAKFEPSGGG